MNALRKEMGVRTQFSWEQAESQVVQCRQLHEQGLALLEEVMQISSSVWNLTQRIHPQDLTREDLQRTSQPAHRLQIRIDRAKVVDVLDLLDAHGAFACQE